jgi:hypothetical protein
MDGGTMGLDMCGGREYMLKMFKTGKSIRSCFY